MSGELRTRSISAKAGRMIELTSRYPAASCGFFFDFDGTLAAITRRPQDSLPVAGATEMLAELSQLGATVAIVSARPGWFLHHHFTGIDLYGLYGMETVRPDGTMVISPEVEKWAPVIARTVDQVREELSPYGVGVEDKRLSVALHFREDPTLEKVIRDWGDETDWNGLRPQNGRMVIELRPPVEMDKGTTLATALGTLKCAWYFGDDVADLAAFHALDRHARRHPDFLPVRAAITQRESTNGLLAAADIQLQSPDEAVHLGHTLTQTLTTHP